ncbi:HesB/IscA family protein [Flavisolibacter ginsenosidimutans]|uniref:Iron-sulfur cluster assembly accessory protein n=1 Tax=Flavisolibacter ginsenosidimutans TaxID=661481 RepID=A0A5B8UEA2_9BACT|nr:iron-sulfur cluster assembly accessory protein [Flavisolibacter ginsenosidimutans]QEC54838.1 iron-sulfur cluster assembly accessory protein [Flavisolibacter ginsenosidimutans]
MNTITEAPVKLAPCAVTELKRLMNEPGFDATNILRIGVKGGGCSGLSYVLGFDKATGNDNEYESEGIRFVIDKAHELYLAGMEIDWENGLNNRGFSFKNPNASSTCGCGTSFAV